MTIKCYICDEQGPHGGLVEDINSDWHAICTGCANTYKDEEVN